MKAGTSYLFAANTTFGQAFTFLWPVTLPVITVSLIVCVVRVAALQIRATNLWPVSTELLLYGVLATMFWGTAPASVQCVMTCERIRLALCPKP